MDPWRGSNPTWTRWLPRASGDGPLTKKSLTDEHAAAPRERGWTRNQRRGHRVAQGCPARAGMDPLLFVFSNLNRGLPRASGDGPMPKTDAVILDKAAPHERGWTQVASGDAGAWIDCPARAGMDLFRGHRSRRTARLPRASGDGPCVKSSCFGSKPAAPRERGSTPFLYVMEEFAKGCPTRVGMDPGK